MKITHILIIGVLCWLIIFIPLTLHLYKEPNGSDNKPTKPKPVLLKAQWVEDGFNNEQEFMVIIVDSCEYLVAGYDRSRTVTHKGNCKFCAERRKNRL